MLLTILGIIADPEEIAKADGININLWGGVAMLVFAAVFVLWARLRRSPYRWKKNHRGVTRVCTAGTARTVSVSV
ncbi:hypothetical protein AB0E63_18750 [Kribbella sp. NPDC026596]|uniref:hypothetical protein n=1 Tax=Kribbella sp. NPDC026596 TaxID=3155122 RepID=UPI0033C73D78